MVLENRKKTLELFEEIHVWKGKLTDQYSVLFEAIRSTVFKICMLYSIVLSCFCQYIDNVNEKNWQKVVMNM